MMCQGRFIIVWNIPLWWVMLIMGESAHAWEQGICENLCTFSILLWTLNCSKKVVLLKKNLDSSQHLLTNTKIGNMDFRGKVSFWGVDTTVIPTFKEFTIQLWNQYLYIRKGYWSLLSRLPAAVHHKRIFWVLLSSPNMTVVREMRFSKSAFARLMLVLALCSMYKTRILCRLNSSDKM